MSSSSNSKIYRIGGELAFRIKMNASGPVGKNYDLSLLANVAVFLYFLGGQRGGWVYRFPEV